MPCLPRDPVSLAWQDRRFGLGAEAGRGAGGRALVDRDAECAPGNAGVRAQGTSRGALTIVQAFAPALVRARVNLRFIRKHGLMSKYDCLKCPGYCCSYPVIIVTARDVTRMAKYFGLTEAETERKYLRSAHGYKRVMRRQKDEHFGKICQFFDTTERRCTIYEARPGTCRSYPGEGRCGYYDFLSAERWHQEDPDFIATTDNT